jgi:hypothetical protein
MERRVVLGLFAGAAVLGAPLVVAQIANINDAINKAGQLRMLSQRLSKAYMALGLGIARDSAQQIVNESMARFDRNLFEVAAFAPKPHIKATYSDLIGVWAEYKSVLLGQAPQRETVPRLVEIDSRILQLSNRGVSDLEDVSGRAIGHLVNVAGRQRMLSQRAAKLYLAQAWKAQLPHLSDELQGTQAEFSAGLAALESAPQATPAIKQEIDLARKQWIFFELGLAYQGTATPKSIENVFSSSENMLRIMEGVVDLYARVVA